MPCVRHATHNLFVQILLSLISTLVAVLSAGLQAKPATARFSDPQVLQLLPTLTKKVDILILLPQGIPRVCGATTLHPALPLRASPWQSIPAPQQAVLSEALLPLLGPIQAVSHLHHLSARVKISAVRILTMPPLSPAITLHFQLPGTAVVLVFLRNSLLHEL